MDKKTQIIAGVVVVIFVLSAAGAWLYISRLEQSKKEGETIVSRAVTPKPIDTNNLMDSNKPNKPQTAANDTPVNKNISLKSGKFTNLDPLHYASGQVDLVQNDNTVTVNFSADFKTNPDGPDLYVWLVKKQDLKNVAVGGVNTDKSTYLNLGKLQKFEGQQSLIASCLL